MRKKKEEYGSNEKMILAVSFNVETGLYNIGACQGSSVNEMAFAIMAVIKTLKRDGYIKSEQGFIDKLNQYLNDPQYAEVE